MKQEYGDAEEWTNHFNYLLQFFLDKRYIKIDNKPVFIIFDISQLKDFDKMAKYRSILAIKEWFDWIYFVETFNSAYNKKYSTKTESLIQFEPLFSLKWTNLSLKNKFIIWFKLLFNKIFSKLFNYKLLYKFNYDDIWNKSLKRTYNKWDSKIWYGWFPRWDNSPRKWNNAYIIIWNSPEKFWKYMKKLKEKCVKEWSEFIFINARNEWAEWNFLEPDLYDWYKYLEELKKL